jgi:membrane protease YdiL (CAAX protease family)
MQSRQSTLRDGIALTFAALFPLVIAFVYFVVLAVEEGDVHPMFKIALGAGKAIQFAFPVVYVALFDLGQLRLSRPSTNGVLIGAGFGVAVGLAMFALYFGAVRHIPAVASDTPSMIFGKLQQLGYTTILGYWLVAVAICVVHSLMEEYYWRWFVFGRMRRYWSFAPAAVLSSIAFMLHHVVVLGVFFPGHFWTLSIPFSLCVAFGGCVWAWIYDRTGSIYAAWLSHALIDAAILILGFWMLRDRLT